MKETPDILIIGGGISGLLTAYEFLYAGATIAVIDQNKTGRESSWAGGGILLPIYPWRQDDAISRLVIESIKIYPEFSRNIHSQSGIDPEWIPCGLLITKNPDFDAAVEWCDAHGIAYAHPCGGLLSGIRSELDSPLWLPEIAQVRNPRLLKSLRKFLDNSGRVSFLENTAFEGVVVEGSRIRSIVTTHGVLSADRFVLTTGAWTGQIWRNLLPETQSPNVEVEPVKGQMLLYDAVPGFLENMVLENDHYLIPRRDGKILAGSTLEHSGFYKQTTAQARIELETFASDLLPALARYPIVEHWAGLRPGTAHGIPYIGNHPDIENLYFNCGHYRNGFAMGPASARLLTDIVCKRPAIVPPEPYQLSALH
ncbi:MAG: NAD(P)/FAD-dependent oxidoreductase [Gammaproteobacteria bacterium]